MRSIGAARDRGHERPETVAEQTVQRTSGVRHIEEASEAGEHGTQGHIIEGEEACSLDQLTNHHAALGERLCLGLTVPSLHLGQPVPLTVELGTGERFRAGASFAAGHRVSFLERSVITHTV